MSVRRVTVAAAPASRSLPLEGLVPGTGATARDALGKAFAVELQAEFDAARAAGLDAARTVATEDARRALDEQTARLAEEHSARLTALTQQAENLRAVETELRNWMQDNLRLAETIGVEVTHAAVLRILGDAAARTALIQHAVADAIEGQRVQAQLRVRVAPSDLAALLAAGDANSAIFVADQGVRPGGCVIETGRGTLDASLDRQMHAFRRALLDAHGHREA